MNFFTKTLLAGVLPCAAVSAQGLYSIAPNDDEASDSLPLTFLTGASIGYDSNPTPVINNDDDSLYISGFVQANLTSVSPQTTWDVYARIGARYYLDDIDAGGDQLNGDIRLGVNYTHRVSERLRFSSRNFVALENEPDFDFGFGGNVRVGNYFRYSSNNSIGYRWTDRLGTQTGVSFTGVIYEELDDADYNRVTFRHDFRYRVSPATVLTAGYRFGVVSNDSGGDANNHYVVGGVEHRISPNSALVLRAGVQVQDPDNGDTRTTPFVEGTLRTQLTEQLSTDVFVRYQNESFNRRLFTGANSLNFESNQTFRLGARATYAVNPGFSVFGGVNYILNNYEDEVSNAAGDIDEGLLNLNIGASYELTQGLYLTGSYNYTTNISDVDAREYERNRVQFGVQATF